MENSGRLGIAGVLTAVGSCIVLVAVLFMALFTWMAYFVSYHYGVRIIDVPFYVDVSIIIFGLSTSVLGLRSASNTLNKRKFSSAILGATFLLIAGLLLATSLVYSNALPYVETLVINPLSIISGVPIFILAAASLILIVQRKKEFNNQETHPQATLKAILILTATISAAFALSSIVPLQQLAGQFASNYASATLTVSACTCLFATTATALLLKKKNIYATTALTALSLLSALTLPFIFNSIYPG